MRVRESVGDVPLELARARLEAINRGIGIAHRRTPRCLDLCAMKYAVAEINRGLLVAAAPERGGAGIGGLPRQQIDRSDLVGDVLGAGIFRVAFDRLVRRDDAGGQQDRGQKQNKRSSQP